MKVLVIAPHPDDETIGCGGSLCLHHRRGDHSAVVFLTSGELGLKHLPRERAWSRREREARQAAAILRIERVHFLRQPDWTLGDHLNAAVRQLRPVWRAEQPDLVYVPHAGEWHPDHQAAWRIVQRLLRLEQRRSAVAIREYEVWTPLAAPEEVEDISRVMPCKLRALRAHRSQLQAFDYERAVRGLNAFRGALSGKCRYAEVFRSGLAEGVA